MLRMTSVLRLEKISTRKTTLMFLALLTASFMMMADGLEISKRRTWQPTQWYWQEIVPYQYVRSFRNVTVSARDTHYDFAWYQRLVGQFRYHKQQLGLQGIRIADWYRTEITITSNEKVPTIILAAAIANQSNSPTRPFNINLFEKMQVWLGEVFDYPTTFGKSQWDDKFESPSIGIAQIMPGEYPGIDVWMLFDDKVSIDLMLEKLQRVSQSALKLKVNRNDWFALTLIGNNFGQGVISDYQAYLRHYSFAPKSMRQFLDTVPVEKRQLARMLAYVQYMAAHEGWDLPQNVDMAYLWSLVE